MIQHENVCDAAETLYNYAQVRGGTALEPLFEAAGLNEETINHALKHAVELGIVHQGNGNLISFSVGMLMGLLMVENHLSIEDKLSKEDEFNLLCPG